MHVFATAAAKVAEGDVLVHVKRRLARPDRPEPRLGAVALLEALVQDVERGGSVEQRSEVTGLLGRAHRQRFVEAVAGGARGDDELRAAVGVYCRVYDLDQAWTVPTSWRWSRRGRRETATPRLQPDKREGLGRTPPRSAPGEGPAELELLGPMPRPGGIPALGDRDNVAACSPTIGTCRRGRVRPRRTVRQLIQIGRSRTGTPTVPALPRRAPRGEKLAAPRVAGADRGRSPRLATNSRRPPGPPRPRSVPEAPFP